MSDPQPQGSNPTPSPQPPAEEVGVDASTPQIFTPDSTDACVTVEFHDPQRQVLSQKPSPTTPEPSSISSATSILSSWYSLTSNSSYEPLGYDSKVYKSYVANIDKCLKNFEYSIEWPDLISALTKLNKVNNQFN